MKGSRGCEEMGGAGKRRARIERLRKAARPDYVVFKRRAVIRQNRPQDLL
jgi:hypothetical protein